MNYSERLGTWTGLGHRHDESYCLAATFELYNLMIYIRT